ncbi:DNA-directed RNA polymerase subunit omega [bacterium]|nr:DNA-directed RNA polymerase subunit omega [bacterium]
MTKITELIFKGIDMVGSEYDYVSILARRALQLQSGQMPFAGSGRRSNLEKAMEEIVSGKVTVMPRKTKEDKA